MIVWKITKGLLCLLFIANIKTSAQHDTLRASTATPELSLVDCLEIGVAENLGLKNQRINVEQSELRKRIFKTSLIFPDINMSARLSEVAKPGESPEFSQSIRAYTNFEIFDMANTPRKRKNENYIRLDEYWVRTSTANLQRDISICYLEANLVRKKQDILLDQLLELDSLLELTLPTDSLSKANPVLLRLRANILPLKESVTTTLKGLETNFEDKIGQLNNLMSLDNSHNFRLADQLELSGNGIVNENEFVEKLIEKAIDIQNRDDNLRKLNLEEDMKLVNSSFFPEVTAGVAYEEDFITNFKGFTANVNVYYNVYDPNAKKKKDIAKLDIEKINNTILNNKRNIERWIRGNYNKSKEHRSQVRQSLIESQRRLYENTLKLFLDASTQTVGASEVINTFKDYYDAQINYYSNIARSEIQKMYIRHLLMDFTTPFDQLDQGE